MKRSASPPAAPDPTATAQAQSRANIETAIANARLNRTNQSTPWGSISWQQGEADANGVPTWSSNVQLSPEQQRLLEYQQQQQQARAQMAQQLLQSMQGTAATRPLDLSGLNPVPNRNSPGGMWNGNTQGSGMAAPPAPQGAPQAAPQGMPPPSMPSVGSATQGAPNVFKPSAADAQGLSIMQGAQNAFQPAPQDSSSGKGDPALFSQVAQAGSGLDGNLQQILAALLRGMA